MAKGLIVSAPGSGSGKTTVTLGLLRALTRAGAVVAPAKAGPDYIDPTYHAAACGWPCHNLDVWAMRRETLAALIGGMATGADLILCEGVMGLFDGAVADGRADVGSTAELAAATGWPVVLVLDVGGQAASVAAVVRGFAEHRPDVVVAGVILNRVGGEGHRAALALALEELADRVPLLGMVPRDERLRLPERHLGLVTAGELADLEAFVDRAAAVVGSSVDVQRLLPLAISTALTAVDAAPRLAPPGQRIAVARDAAFAFAYAAVLDGWRAAGAEVTLFSPLDDEAPGDSDAVYLPGGYPELHAGRLAASTRFRRGLCASAERGAAVYGECGGYMVLGEGLVDRDGARHAMTGLLPLETSFAAPKLHLGYRQVTLAADHPLGPAGAAFRGHEFHYARATRETADPLFHVCGADGRERGTAGMALGRVAGSFMHLIDRAP